MLVAMNRDPEQRLARLVRHSRTGWRLVRSDPVLRGRVEAWLRTHPSPRAEVDRAWLECLAARGELARWLEGDASPSAWRGAIPLRCLLASHPFRELPRWSIRRTSRAS